ncbi:thermonuclease family protein [Halocynthiibacter styelae]|uniref:Thermonuclease family protein n=1 Tax=Halocynthiibacter styelae TaxID=2761955 RepID=A0A8J7ITJ5_9RHOB|nr:thermonuclease family protein [Paenihalocynthiibacter styelae]MBI1492033.1 thermonuclease family protein [Paenihalocynthiibacter styelae]
MITRTYIIPAALTLILAFSLYQMLKPEPGAMQLLAADIYVVDGDTIRVGDDSIRLDGFNTPETRFAACERERAMGIAARDRLQDLLNTASEIRMVLTLTRSGTPARDKYRRLIGRLLLNGQDVADVLITEGYAEPYTGGQRRSWCQGSETS